MKTLAILAIAALAAMAADWRDWTHHEEESIQRAFTVSASGRELLVDNISGYVHVTGSSGGQVQVNVKKQIRARSAEAIQEAKRDVKLDISQQGNVVRLYEDGPFRDHGRGEDYYGYHVIFDCDVQVPKDTELVLKTVNNGDIVVKGTSGNYDIHGLNGGIEMEDVEGSGNVHTLNGKLMVRFARNPLHDSSFHTLNGAMDIYFQPPLDADLHYRTLNGGVFADFDVAPIPGSTGGREAHSGMFVYRPGRNQEGRAGKGGPALTFDGLNGAIRLHTKTL